MNLIAKSDVKSGFDLNFVREDCPLGSREMPYPIVGIKSLEYTGKAYNDGKYPHVEMAIRAVVTLEDSYDAVHFDKEITLEDEADIMEDEDEEGEGFIMPGKDIDLDLLAVSFIHSYLPIKVLREGSKLPSGSGIIEIVEEGGVGEADGSPFDVLKDEDFR